MRVVTDNGSIELGTVEANPTIGITDYSRRVTDDFGVTTVVPRGFSRRMSVRLAVPFDEADEIQRQLADLRATPATWIADDRFASLSVRGFYKDFEVDLAVPPLSYCTLTLEGLAEADDFVDAGGDPAADGASTLRMVDPVAVDDAVLISSSVDEDARPAWSATKIYGKGAAVSLAATHRVYESVVEGNLGNSPEAAPDKWLDVGPTNAWAMFDQALGTSTVADVAIQVVLRPETAVTALAVLDTNAAAVRVTAPGYDRTIAVNDAGKALFLDLDLPAATSITVRLTPAEATAAPRRWDDGATWLDESVWRDSLAAGDGTVTIGTMLVGAVRSLGVTEASPTAGIIDYSRKVTDEFGEVTVVPRAWAKRMAAKALIRSDAVDVVAGRLAAVRARPVLWLGQEGLDSLTVYGFFKDFSIEIDEAVSKLSLSIEGLSAAAKIEPLKASVDWPDIGDPAGTKPADGATVGMTDEEARRALVTIANGELGRIRDRALLFPAPDGASTYTLHRREETARVAAQTAIAETFDLLGAVGRAGTAFVFSDNAVFAQEGGSGGTTYVSVAAALNQQKASIEDVRQVIVGPTGSLARALVTLDVNGRTLGYRATNDGTTGDWTFVADRFSIETPKGTKLFYADETDGGRVKMPHVEVDTIKVDSVGVREVAQGSVQKSAWAQLGTDFDVAHGATSAVFTLPFVKEDNDSALKVLVFLNLKSADDLQCDVSIQVDGMVMQQAQRINLVLDNANSQAQAPLTPFVFVTGILAGARTITVKVYNRETDNIPLTVVMGSALEVTELRKAAIGSITGSGAALPMPGTGGSGTGAGGSYDGKFRNQSQQELQ